MTPTKLSTMSVYEKNCAVCEVVIMFVVIIFLMLAIGMAEIEKAADNKAFYQSQLDRAVINATTKRIVTCNDDIIAGYCAKYGVYKSEFEKGNN